MQLHKLQLDLEQQHLVPTSTPRPSGGSRLHSSDPTSNKKYIQEGNVQNSFTGVVGQVELQNSTRAQPELVVTSTSSSNTCDTTVFYPGEVPFKTKELAHHQSLQKLQETCPNSKLWAREVRKRVLEKIKFNTQP